MATVQQLLDSARQQIDSIENPHLETELLLSRVLGKTREFLYAWPGHELSAVELNNFHDLLHRRIHGEPIAYLLGHREFWSLDLQVNSNVLIPRADTERLVEVVLDMFPHGNLNVVDLGTGSGAIALALASERPDWEVTATDNSEAALHCARFNAEHNSILNISFTPGDWCIGLPEGSFDIVVSNPPYIDANDPHLLQGDLRFEPRSALVSEDEGLADIRKIASDSSRILKPGGHLFLEHGFSQASAVRQILEGAGYVTICTWQDLSGNDRVTGGQKQP